MNELDYALETADGRTFRNLSAAFLRSRGYRIPESGDDGPTRVWMEDLTGFASASVRRDWRRKLREDAEEAERLEEDREGSDDLLVFVTNRTVTGLQRLDVEREIEREYGWRLRLYDRQDLLGAIHGEAPGLAKHHLDVNLGFDTNHLANLEELRDERLEVIRDRRREATELDPGPAVAVHVVPNGVFSTEKRRSSMGIPSPSVLAEHVSFAVDTRGKLKVAYGRGGTEGYRGYALLRNDGLYESATTDLFFEPDDGGLWLRSSVGSGTPGLDASVVIAVRDTLAHLSEMGFAGTASIWVSLLDAAGAKLDRGRFEPSIPSSSALKVDGYVTDVATSSIAHRDHEDVMGDLEPALSELWREFGYPDGTPHIEAGEWRGGAITAGDFAFP